MGSNCMPHCMAEKSGSFGSFGRLKARLLDVYVNVNLPDTFLTAVFQRIRSFLGGNASLVQAPTTLDK